MKWKYPLPYQQARNVIAIGDFWPSNVNDGSQNCDPVDSATPPMPHPPWWLLRNWGNARSSQPPLLKVNKKTGLAPDSWGAYERNEFSKPRVLHLHIHRMLDLLYLIFDVQTACSLCCKLVFSLTYPPASLRQFSQSYGDVDSQTVS